jgi:sugar O-acyltransferase (sialic acid O-acetyltransferase NeuD family)
MSWAGLLILGFGGHARSVADIALCMGMPCLRFYDADARIGEQFHDFPAIAILPKVLPEGWAFLPAAGDNRARAEQLDCFAADRLATLVSPRAYVGVAARLGAGSLVAHAAHLGPAVEVGRGAIINTGAIVDHESSIGDCSHVSVGATVAGRCRIGRRVMLGAGATVRDGRCIGDDIVIGAGAVVVSDLLEPGVYAGVPAKPLRRLSVKNGARR